MLVREDDLKELLSELDNVIKENERQFVLENDADAYTANWRIANNDVCKLAHWLLLADPNGGPPELLARFHKTQYSTTRWLLSWGLKDCGDESALVALKDAFRKEKHPPYRFEFLNAYIRCDALCRLKTYSDALSDDRLAMAGEFAGGAPAIGTCSNLATRELARMVKLGPSVREKDSGLDIDSKDAARWRDWFSQNGRFLRMDKHGRYFMVDEDAKACAISIRDWDRLHWETKDELARKAGRL